MDTMNVVQPVTVINKHASAFSTGHEVLGNKMPFPLLFSLVPRFSPVTYCAMLQDTLLVQELSGFRFVAAAKISSYPFTS